MINALGKTSALSWGGFIFSEVGLYQVLVDSPCVPYSTDLHTN